MKKALVVLLALVCLSAVAFAQAKPAWSITNLYGFGVYMPSSGNLLVPYDYSNEGTGRTRFGFTYTAADGNAGFNSRLQVTPSMFIAGTGAFGALNQLNGWGKLLGGFLTVRGGILDDYTIAGTSDWLCLGNTDGSLGVFFDVTPITGLDIGLFQAIPVASTAANMNGDVIGVAFSIPNLVRVAGGAIIATQTATAGTKVYAGVTLTAVPGLAADVEAGFVLANGDTPIEALEHVAYTMGPLTIGLYAGEWNDKVGFDWGIEPVVNYKVMDNLTLGVDVNLYNVGNSGFGAGKLTNVSWITPLDGGPFTAGQPSTLNYGGGVHANWAADGFTLTVGDYYSGANNNGNMLYVNADVSL